MTVRHPCGRGSGEARFRIRQSDDMELLEELSNELMGPDVWEERDHATHWILWLGSDPVGFCSAELIDKETAYLTAGALCPIAQGGGLQKRLIHTRTRWAKRMGATQVITYTLLQNYPSMSNLFKAGFRFYLPEYPWVGEDVHYFYKEL